MAQPININNVPMNYFLHGVDAMRGTQAAQAPGGAGVQPAEGGAAGEAPAVENGPAAKMVQQLDVLLVKAAKASTTSVDGKMIKSSLAKLVADGALDKGSLKLLASAADTAGKTLKALNKFTGAQLADEAKTGKAVRAAVDAQNALSDLLTQLDRQLNSLERHDADMRKANPNYKGVDGALHDEVRDLRLLCDRRATEIAALAAQMHDFAVHQAARGANKDPNVTAILKAKVDELLPRQALAMHGTADALSTVSEEVSGRLRPLAEKIDAFRRNPGATVGGEGFLALQSDIRTMKAAVVDIKENGIQVGGGRVIVPKDIMTALEQEVAKAETLFKTARRDVQKRMLDNFLATAVQLFSVDDPTEYQLQHTDSKAVKFFNLRDSMLVAIERLNAEVLSETATQETINQALDMARDAAEKLYDASLDVSIPAGQNAEAVTKLVGNAQAAHTIMAQLANMANNMLSSTSDRLFTGSEAMSIFKGELSVSSIVESRARGLRDGDVDPANEDANIESTRQLGAGNAGTVYLLRRKDGSEVVFKGEMESRAGLDTICAGKGAAYRKGQQTVNLNIASKNAANALGCGDLIVNYKAGTHNGVFGFFMDKAKGRPAKEIAGKGGDTTAEAGLTVKEISKLEPAERRRVRGEMMRQLNRLQWLDMVTGQLDRHGDNYFIHVDRQTHKVTVKGIDNDASFSKYRTGVGTFALDKGRTQRLFDSLVKVLKDAGVRNPKDEAKRIFAKDPSITRDGSRVTVDALKVDNKAILAALKELTGAQSLALPDRIDRELYVQLMEMKDNPAKRKEYLDSLRPRMGAENVAAAEARLNDAIAHAEQLAKRDMVVADDAWGDVPTEHRNTHSIRIELPGGKEKKLSTKDSFFVNGMMCESYFTRDKLDRLFE